MIAQLKLVAIEQNCTKTMAWVRTAYLQNIQMKCNINQLRSPGHPFLAVAQHDNIASNGNNREYYLCIDITKIIYN